MSDSEILFQAEKVFVHRWPHDPPLWGETTKQEMDESINKNPEMKNILVSEKSIKIQNTVFTNLKKIGISVPFFKPECRIIFESQFDEFFAHVHITLKSENYLDVFNKMIEWRKINFSENSQN